FQISPPQTITIRNSGTLPVKITGIAFAVDEGYFRAAPGNFTGGTLPVGGAVNLSYLFTPHFGGWADGGQTIGDSEQVIITSDAIGSPHQVSLTGRAAIPRGVLSISPPSLNFGQVPVGANSPPQTITLTCSGPHLVRVSSITTPSSPWVKDPGSFE